MSNNYDYSPLANGYKASSRYSSRFWKLGCLALLAVDAILVVVYFAIFHNRGLYYPLDRFQQLSNISVVNAAAVPISLHSTLINPKEHAVVSSLYTDEYTTAIITLGHSLKAVNVTVPMILIYMPGRLSSRSLCLATTAGWSLHPVSHIPPPFGGKGINWLYGDQYTKLTIWTLDSIGIKSLVYLDADTLVRKNFDELFSLPFNFGAVPDVFKNYRGFSIGFNAGVLFLRPNTTVFNDMISKLETAVFPYDMAEQAFLNVYFGSQVSRLPYAYNANMAAKVRNAKLWEAMEDDIRILHYTVTKPFPFKGLKSRETLKQFFRERLTMENGFWAKEMRWWQEAWRETAIAMQSQPQCL